MNYKSIRNRSFCSKIRHKNLLHFYKKVVMGKTISIQGQHLKDVNEIYQECRL